MEAGGLRGLCLDRIGPAEEPFVCDERARKMLKMLKNRCGETDLVYRGGKFFLLATVHIHAPPPQIPGAWLRVDVGIVNLATDSDGEVHTSERTERPRKRYERIRGKLQKAGTKSAKRHLKKLSGKERRFKRDTNHVLSKRLVEKAEESDRGIALEDLTGSCGGGFMEYQRTEVDPDRTVSELAAIIRRYGGRRFEQSWDRAGNPTEVRFAIDHPDLGELPVRLVAKTEKIRGILHDEGLWRSYPDDEREARIKLQAHRIAWRHIKDLTEQLLMAVSLDLQDLHEAFMASVEVVDTDTGELVRMAEFLQRRARQEPEGLVLSPTRGAIPLPPAG